MNAHDITEHARLLSHRIYAEKIDADPALLDLARTIIKDLIAKHGGTMGHLLWHRLLRSSWPEIRQKMLAEDQWGRALRTDSPFSLIPGMIDEDVRRGLWRKAKAELQSRAQPATLAL